MTAALPFVFILDWDGTIAGRVDFQVQQFSLHASLKKYGFKPLKQYQIPPAFYPNAKLIRPGFASFIKAIQHFYNDNVYFVIYTASEKQWAHQEIAWVEKTHNIKFMRPIFTRDDCIVDSAGNYRKSLTKIFPRIMRVFGKNLNLSNKDKHHILEHQTIIIDNNAVYTDRSDKLLLCPDYNYAVFENLLHGIPISAREHPDIQKMIYSMINQGLLCPMPGHNEDGMKILTKQYSWLAAKCKALTDTNATYENDEFWKHLRKLIIENKLTIYNSSVIEQLQNAIWKRYNKKGLKQ